MAQDSDYYTVSLRKRAGCDTETTPLTEHFSGPHRSSLEGLSGVIRSVTNAMCVDIHVPLRGPGGEVDEMKKWFDLFDAVRNGGGRVYTYLPSHAHSAHAYVFTQGDPGRQFIAPQAVLGFHNPTMPAVKLEEISDIARLLRESRELTALLHGQLERFLSKAPAEVRSTVVAQVNQLFGNDEMKFFGRELANLAAVHIMDSTEMADTITLETHRRLSRFKAFNL